MAPSARYDDIAEWYEAWVRDHGEGLIADAVGELRLTLPEARVLDVACGHGRAARALAQRGARVVGVDLSTELIRAARSTDAADGEQIRFHAGDMADVEGWWDGEAFDGAICEMAVMDIEDLSGVLSGVASVLRPRGWLVISMVHPCFPGGGSGLSSWPPHRSYFDEGFWTSAVHNPDGVRIRVGSTHRTLSTVLNTTIGSGFAIDRVIEPRDLVPTFLLLHCRRD